jgi:hypothetical protein
VVRLRVLNASINPAVPESSFGFSEMLIPLFERKEVPPPQNSLPSKITDDCLALRQLVLAKEVGDVEENHSFLVVGRCELE